MTTPRPSLMLMTTFVLTAAGLFAVAAAPLLHTAAQIAL